MPVLQSGNANRWADLLTRETEGFATRHLGQVRDRLPPEVSAYFSERRPSVIVWEGGALPAACDVVIAPNAPVGQLGRLLAAGPEVCIVTGSLDGEETLPPRHGLYERIHHEKFDDPERGPTLLVVYASSEFRRSHGRSDRAAAEQEKWDSYYAGLGEAEETPALQAFHEEFTKVTGELLPAGASVLEAGCGAGFQSLALRDGRFRISLMDISPEALDAARRLFSRGGLEADARLGDVFAPGEPRHDLVFNAGVLEHYTLDQQARFLRGMASRSRRFVLVLVPNRLCYWYWVWRVQQSTAGNWPFGKECPVADLAESFRAAGLTYLGRAFLGAAWTEALISELSGLDTALKEELLALHRAGFAPPAQRCYLTAVLGCVGESPSAIPSRWSAGTEGNEIQLAEVTAGLADALALRIAGEGSLRKAATREADAATREAAVRSELAQAAHDRDNAQVALQSFRHSAAYKLAESILRIRAKIRHPFRRAA